MADDPVIVTGGSVNISFDETVYPGNGLHGGNFSNGNKRITYVEIRDDNTNQTQTVNAPTNGKCTVTIHCE